MNQHFFPTQYSQEELQQRLAQRRAQNGRSRPPGVSVPQPQKSSDDTNMTELLGGDSLDDIITQNNREIKRRQSLPQPFLEQSLGRRSSMLDFGAANGGLSGYQFAPATTAGSPVSRQQSLGGIDISGYGDMVQGVNMAAPQMGYTAGIQTREPLAIDTSGYGVLSAMSPEIVQGMMSYSPLNMEGMSADSSGMNMFAQDDFSQTYSAIIEPMPNQYMVPGPLGAVSQQNNIDSDEGDQDMNPAMSGLGVSEGINVNSPANMSMGQNTINYHSPSLQTSMQPLPLSRELSYTVPDGQDVSPAQDTEVLAKVEPKVSQYKNIYSQSGFDMMGALIKVATRKDPEIHIGKVDLSCAFVVCDVTQHDSPIVYVSEIFERLTGYTKYEVLGRNCRFLQSPDGKVQAGARREFVDNDSVAYLRERIDARKEAQRSLINYRKGGQPFMNLLTMIPITGEDDKDIKYYVGFQVDLVEKPTSVEAKGVNGMYVVDYTQGELPKYTWEPPDGIRLDEGQTFSRDVVSSVLNAMNSNNEGDSTVTIRDKVLLENTDDVIHVISLKGLFLYLSPSCSRVLEYDPSELMNTALSSICHPSDIVPVTRELKDTSSAASVSIVFRIRRKKSGYTWFESHGSLHVEQGKGRKFIILVGRERPVYALARRDLDAAGGIGENEMWTKLSTSGMFLFVSSNVRTLLDRAPEDLVGTSIQQLMRSESKVEFGRSLEKARAGRRVTYKHEVLNKRGLNLHAQTTLYPGDAGEGSKPTFLVAQTRLLKPSSRTVTAGIGAQHAKTMYSLGKNPRSEDSSPLSHLTGLSSQGPQEGGELTPRSSVSFPGPITEAGGAGLVIGSQDHALASDENIFDELKTTRCTSWQFELRQMEKSNRLLADELASLLSNKKKRKRRRGAGHLQRDCANCHTRVTPEWRRGPSGQRDLCNSCGLRWAKQTGRVSPRTSTKGGDGSKTSQKSASPLHNSPSQKEFPESQSQSTPNLNPPTGSGIMGNGGATAIPGSLGGRSTIESHPVHPPSMGFMEGGARGITRIGEEKEENMT
ncbi:PAS domain-containing protein [Bisporella sp. PMI_857]|nr:PAS domain-containing protein [Bisporella sp. PMI_857]